MLHAPFTLSPYKFTAFGVKLPELDLQQKKEKRKMQEKKCSFLFTGATCVREI